MDIIVNSWNELNDELFKDTFNPSISRFRSNFAYRGLNKSSYKLENGIIRMGKPYPNMEKNLIKQFKKYAHDRVVERDTEWHWLSIAQHHGLPTRLLDWTYSPFIALHFATSSMADFGHDSAVWKVNFAEVHELLQEEHKQKLNALGSQIFSADVLADTIRDIDVLSSKHSSNFDIAVFFEPPAIDDRIVNQFAYFSALSDPYLAMDDWLNKQYVSGKVTISRIIIPSGLKWEVRDKLDQSNINERVLMPGLDGLCQWLQRHYKPV
ncbi:FRG domain-containing protein [Bosea sp. ASV33]|uniref:FRG domain-containing protein n=1 Tax=Bosea sp. ASV33 TaxID=2795106 RepID=UPI0018EB54CD|nr:FRG domain-containing protein [Bosea sp. ASV33]